MVRGIAIGVALLRFRPNGAKCDSLGQRPRKRQSKNQSPNGAKPTVLHRVVPPRWGFVDWVAPSTQGDALGFHLVGLWPGTAWCVESQSALHSCDSAPNGAKCDSLGQRPRKRLGGPVHPGRCPGLSPCGPLARNRMVRGIAIGVALLRFRPEWGKM